MYSKAANPRMAATMMTVFRLLKGIPLFYSQRSFHCIHLNGFYDCPACKVFPEEVHLVRETQNLKGPGSPLYPLFETDEPGQVAVQVGKDKPAHRTQRNYG